MTTIPYQSASSGASARDEVTRMLQKFGCESVGFMDDFTAGTVSLAFKHRGRPVQLTASAKGWAALYLKHHPFGARTRGTRADYEAKALKQGLIAVNSILRDWVKGQLMAVECGLMSFEAVFLPHMLTNDGRPIVERIMEAKMLPHPSTN